MMHSRYLAYLSAYTAEPDIHERRKVTFLSSEKVLPLVLCGSAGVFDSILIWGAISGFVPAMVALAMHIIAVAAAWLFALTKEKLGLETRVVKLLLLMITVAGPFGALGGLVALFAHMYRRNVSFSFQQWFDFIYPRHNLGLGEALYDGIILGMDEHARTYDVLPYIDIMRFGSDKQKREAINQMTMRFQPQFSPALQLALQDESHVVRTLAAISVVKIQNHFSAVEAKLEKTLARNEGRAEYVLAIAKFYDDFAFCGLLDEQRKEDYLNKAYDYYQRYLRRKHTDARVIAWIGRLLIRSHQYERAAEWLKEALSGGYTDPTVVAWYAEVLYLQQRYAELRELIQTYGQRLRSAGEGTLADVVDLWLQQEVNAA
jgi:polysaccharide biosynthesis protein PelE